jgi:putative protein-disulfide isomerase
MLEKREVKKLGLILASILFLAISIYSINSSQSKTKMENKKGRIIYVFDPLCGWCYGFSKVMAEFYSTNQNQYNFEIVSGGMVIGDRVEPIGKIAPYLKNAFKDVENASGIEFGKKFIEETLEKGTIVFNSVPPSIALAIVKKEKPEFAIPFAEAVQKAIYFDGIDPNNKEEYSLIAANYGFDKNEFTKKQSDVSFLKLAENDFHVSDSLKVNGFPTVFYVNSKNEAWPISRGYVSLNSLNENLNKVVSSQK